MCEATSALGERSLNYSRGSFLVRPREIMISRVRARWAGE